MTYKIINTRQIETILYTEVEYDFDGTIVLIEVAHFNPQSKEEIETNILNRASSELIKIEISNSISGLINDIDLNQVKNINL